MAVRRAIECIELDGRYRVTVLCEPQMGKRGLYPDLSTRWSGWAVRDMMNLLAYSDGEMTLFEIAETIHIPFWQARQLADMLLEADLLSPV